MSHMLLVATVVMALYATVIAAVYVPLAALSARRKGYRLFSARRIAALRTGRGDFVGGPFDGCTMAVPRSALLGLGIANWPDVMFDAITRRYSLVPEGQRPNPSSCDPRSVWAGYYLLRHMSDRYEWEPTGLERFADAALADGAA